MSLDALAITKWSSKLIADLRDAHVYKLGTNQDYEDEIKYAAAVKIFQAPRFQTAAYTRDSTSVSYVRMSPAEQVFIVDQRQYFGGKVDNLEKLIAMAGGRIWEESIQGGAWELADDVDDYIAAALAAGVASANVMPARTIGLGLNANAFDWLVEAKILFQKANIPPNMRHVFAPPEFFGFLAKDSRFTGFNTTDAQTNIRGLQTGKVVQGFTLHETNNAPVSGTTYTVMAVWEKAMTYGEQLAEIQYFEKFEASFDQGVRQELVFGGKVTQPQGIASCAMQFAT